MCFTLYGVCVCVCVCECWLLFCEGQFWTLSVNWFGL